MGPTTAGTIAGGAAEAYFDSIEQRARPRWFTAVTNAAIHISCLGVLLTGITRTYVALFACTYVVRVLGVMGGYHRYFSHRAFKTSRAFQLFLAVLGSLGAHRGVLWWASHHRHHHRYSDTRRDIFSPMHRSFFYAHMGWAMDINNADTDLERVPDFTSYPELLWLDKWALLPWVLSSAVIVYFFGFPGFVWGVCMSTVLNWQAVHCIGSLSHRYGGYRTYATTDNSRNKWWIALILLGEWHNNHHFYPTSAKMGLLPWELDPIYWLICVLRRLGLVWDVRVVPEHLVRFPEASAQAGIKRMTAWLLEVRTAIAHRVEASLAAYGAEVEGAAIARVKYALDARVDELDAGALDLVIRDPEGLGPTFAAFRAGLREEVGGGALPPAFAERLEHDLGETVTGLVEACPFGHFLDHDGGHPADRKR